MQDTLVSSKSVLPTDPEFFKGLNCFLADSCCFKKCCKKHKHGKRCKSCPKK